jgi:hypothetical protein
MSSNRPNNDQTFAGVFFIGLAILFITGYWWPGIMFVIGIAMLVRTVSQGRSWTDDRQGLTMLGIGVVFALLDLFSNLNLSAGSLWPLVLIGIGVYLLFGKNLRPGGGSNDKTKNDDIV